MKLHRKIIQEEIKRLKEEKYPMPPEIQNALEVKLKMYPVIRYVDYIKAVNSIPPSYEINLHNGRNFIIFYEDFSLMVKLEGREYYLMDMEERNNAIEHINRILVTNNVQPLEPEEEESADDTGGDTGEDTGGGADDTAMEPEEEPAEEPPADEEEMI